MSYKEKQPVARKVIKHGQNKGRIDMSLSPQEVPALGGKGVVDTDGLLNAIRQSKRLAPRKNFKGLI